MEAHVIEVAIQALVAIFEPARFFTMLVGIGIGLTVGMLPGLGGIVGMSLLLPFVYGLDPSTAMALLIGIVAVIHTADSFPSILLGVPGSAGSQATILDGYPLAQKGEAGRAFGAAFFASMIGGLIGAVAVFLFIPIARPLVLLFGSPELLMLAILGLSMVAVLSGDTPLRGILAGALGLMLAAVGAAPAVPHYRYTFDSLYLFDGIPLAVVALGLFALPEMLDLLIARGSIARTLAVGKGRIAGIRDVLRHKALTLRCSVIGVAIGLIPGLGGSVVDWISYGQAVQTTSDKDRFGHGDIRGVIAPESSNNAKEGGTLIPTLIFGIPGSGTTAVLLGGFLLVGLQPGPAMLTTHLDTTVTIIWTLAIANVIGALACLAASGWVSRLTLIPAARLFPVMLVIMLVGAYQTSRHWGDILGFLAIGLLGWVMKSFGWPRPALLIGFVLATSVERYLWISISRYEWTWLMRPGVIIIALLTIGLTIAGARVKGAVESER